MPADRDSRLLQILLVEDSADDADLMVEALREGTLDSRIHVVEDGEQALAYLRRQGAYAAVAIPDLILLDLHLPRKNGFEVLAEVKEDSLLRRIPVVVLTSSDSEEAVLRAYDLQANCYVTKPANQEQFALVVQKIEQFWLRFVRRA